jgi:hypothetical protein
VLEREGGEVADVEGERARVTVQPHCHTVACNVLILLAFLVQKDKY